MSDIQVPLLPTHYYHIYNHAIGGENIFERDDDYLYFLKQTKKHLGPVCTILSFCLLPNHFHLAVQIKPEAEISEYLSLRLGSDKFGRRNAANEYFISDQVSQHFGNLFNTYSKHYNFFKKRTGSLFKRAFRRIEITDMNYFKNVIYYIHQNPVKAGFASDMSGWRYSSYSELIKGEINFEIRDEVMELFGGFENFLAFHNYKSGR